MPVNYCSSTNLSHSDHTIKQPPPCMSTAILVKLAPQPLELSSTQRPGLLNDTSLARSLMTPEPLSSTRRFKALLVTMRMKCRSPSFNSPAPHESQSRQALSCARSEVLMAGQQGAIATYLALNPCRAGHVPQEGLGGGHHWLSQPCLAHRISGSPSQPQAGPGSWLDTLSKRCSQ